MGVRKWCTEDFRCGFCCPVQLSIPIINGYIRIDPASVSGSDRRVCAGLQGVPIAKDVCEISIVALLERFQHRLFNMRYCAIYYCEGKSPTCLGVGTMMWRRILVKSFVSAQNHPISAVAQEFPNCRTTLANPNNKIDNLHSSHGIPVYASHRTAPDLVAIPSSLVPVTLTPALTQRISRQLGLRHP